MRTAENTLDAGPPAGLGSPAEPAPGRRLRAVAAEAARWAPALFVAAVSAIVLHRYEVPARQLAVFGIYVAAAVTLPGTLLWRALRGGPRHIAEDLAAGTAFGYAVDVLAYFPARWAGAPLLFLLVPGGIVAAFLVVPRLRRHWRGGGKRAPVAWSWGVAAVLGVVLIGCGQMVFRHLPLHGATPPRHVDLTFHLALIGELRHHLPPVVPWVSGEPLHYHWFVYAEMAATSHVTGIEAETLLLRLSILPMIVSFAVLIAVTARRVSQTWWTGPAALVINYLLVAPAPTVSVPRLGFYQTTQLSPYMWLSPTQNFGALLFAALLLPVIDLLRAHRTDWVPIGLLIAVVCGAKATYLPLLLAALIAVAAAQLVALRRVGPGLPALAGLVLGALAFVHVVLYGGASQGLTVDPEASLRFLAWKIDPVQLVMANGLVVVAGWCCLWSGISGLVLRRRWLLDPATLLLLGLGAVGLGVLFLSWQPGLSQFYFRRAADPYLAVATAAGWGVLAGRLRRGSGRLRRGSGRPRRSAAVYAVAAGVLPLTALTVAASVQRQPELWHKPLRPEYALAVGKPITERGGRAAARWLRAHSAPGDLVATNVHCLIPAARRCDDRHFWVSAYTERRMLVEGWGYTERTNARTSPSSGAYQYLPFWDRARLAANDAAFRTPDARTVGVLRDRYGVRWLFADARARGLSPRLSTVATLRFRRGDCAVYEIEPRERGGRGAAGAS